MIRVGLGSICLCIGFGRELNWRDVECQHLTKENCNILCEHTSYDTCDGICFEHWPYIMEKTKWIMRYKFLHSTYQPSGPLVFHRQHYNVAWHIRVGDINLQLGKVDYFLHIAAQLEQLLEGFDYRIYFFAEDPFAIDRPPRGYEFLSQLPQAVFINQMPVDLTLFHFLNADMVITSGG